jgi:mono/diheme cytochrome c family protein
MNCELSRKMKSGMFLSDSGMHFCRRRLRSLPDDADEATQADDTAQTVLCQCGACNGQGGSGPGAVEGRRDDVNQRVRHATLHHLTRQKEAHSFGKGRPSTALRTE